ncbi:hypothetical protein Tco_0869556 [Tanacetum coccineum]
MRDFHKTHPSGPGAVKIIHSVTNEGTCVKLGVPDVTEEESSESEAESWGNDEDYRNNKQDLSGEDSDQKNDSDDDKTQSDNENESNSEHETKENESGSESDQDKNEEDEGQTSWRGTDAAMTNIQQGNENPEILQVIKDAHVTLSKFLNFSDIPHTDAEIVSPMDVHVYNEVPSQQTPTLLTVPVLVISDSSPVFSTVIPQSLPSFTPPPHQSTSTPPPTTEATNPLYTLPDFASVFQFNNRVTTLEKEVAELQKDPLHTQVTALVDDHLATRLGASRDEFMNFLSASLTARITEQVKNQLP